MAQTHESQSWQAHEETQEQLKSAVEKLTQKRKQRLSKKYGLTENFKEKATTEKAALEMCQKAMESLESEFIFQLETFIHEEDPIKCLSSLEEAETTWQAEYQVIKELDAGGQEVEFLSEMRLQTFGILSQKLEKVATNCQRDASHENVALTLAVLGLLDQIMDELGYDKDHKDRKAFRDTARTFIL